MIKRLSSVLDLLMLHNAFLRLRFNHAGILYDQPHHDYFIKKKRVQYQACLVIIDAIKFTSREKFFQELGLESLKERR